MDKRDDGMTKKIKTYADKIPYWSGEKQYTKVVNPHDFDIKGTNEYENGVAWHSGMFFRHFPQDIPEKDDGEISIKRFYSNSPDLIMEEEDRLNDIWDRYYSHMCPAVVRIHSPYSFSDRVIGHQLIVEYIRYNECFYRHSQSPEYSVVYHPMQVFSGANITRWHDICISVIMEFYRCDIREFFSASHSMSQRLNNLRGSAGDTLQKTRDWGENIDINVAANMLGHRRVLVGMGYRFKSIDIAHSVQNYSNSLMPPSYDNMPTRSKLSIIYGIELEHDGTGLFSFPNIVLPIYFDAEFQNPEIFTKNKENILKWLETTMKNRIKSNVIDCLSWESHEISGKKTQTHSGNIDFPRFVERNSGLSEFFDYAGNCDISNVRNINKVSIEDMRNRHDKWVNQERKRLEKAEKDKLKKMYADALKKSSSDNVAFWFPDGTYIYKLQTTDEYKLEGHVMHHCVASYYKKYQRDDYEMFSEKNISLELGTGVYSIRGMDGMPTSTFELNVSNVYDTDIKQHKGKHNSSPSREDRDKAYDFIDYLNETGDMRFDEIEKFREWVEKKELRERSISSSEAISKGILSSIKSPQIFAGGISLANGRSGNG